VVDQRVVATTTANGGRYPEGLHEGHPPTRTQIEDDSSAVVSEARRALGAAATAAWKLREELAAAVTALRAAAEQTEAVGQWSDGSAASLECWAADSIDGLIADYAERLAVVCVTEACCDWRGGLERELAREVGAGRDSQQTYQRAD